MRKILTILMLLALTVPAWAGEKTITISRNDVDWESANTVYNVTKGGVELVMSGGMNNPNFLLMKQHTTITVKSHNFNIKRIVFHCLDNYTNDNLDPFYWGPTTLHIQYSQTHAETAGTLTYNYGGSSYDALWVSTKSSSPGNYPNGLPAGYELMFENEGKPVRFASIDIVVEQEVGDVYELVTDNSEIVDGQTYILVNRKTANDTQGRAFSVNQYNNSTSGNFLSTPVDLLDNGLRVKATGEVLLMKLEASDNSEYNHCITTGGGYLRTETQAYSSDPESYRISRTTTKPSNTAYVNTKININSTGIETNWGYFAQIGFQQWNFNKRIYHYNTYNQYRTLNTSWASTENRVYLYKPAQQYKVTTEVRPEDSYGTISLRDGVLVNNGINWSQKMETVQFLVTPAEGYKVKNITIQQLNGTEVVGTVDIMNSSQTINGTLYNFEMPGNDVNIVVEFEPVVYHNINMVVKPRSVCGNIFVTEGYVVQNDQVKSYEGQNVVFNVTPNPINPASESEGYYELSYVTITDNVTGVETTLVPDANGNYTFTMPDNEVTITAYFYDNTKSPLWLLGTANGNETWHTYGPRFNYNDETDEYYIDAYFKGTGNYGSQEGEAFGRFSVTWKIDMNDNWSNINGGNWRGVPGENDYLVNETNTAQTAIYLWYGSQYENNAFKIPAGIYRIYVGTTASQNKGNLANNQLKVEKYNTTLTFDPAGGTTAAEAVEVPQHQLVALQGDLYNKIKAINPNEADANFMYKATVDGSTITSESAGASTTQIATLDVVNEGETVTLLEGWNYLGWIVANNTSYYKVIDTPLHWIEENGEEGKTYTVSDQLQGVYRFGASLWCKDLGDKSIVRTHPEQGQEDFMKTHYFNTTDNVFETVLGREDWDQSNWVELDFSDYANGVQMAEEGKGKLIEAGTVRGTLINKLNYKMKVTSGELEIVDIGYYEPNIYCTVNFLPANLTLNGDAENYPASETVNDYYFLNPKVQEYAYVTWAQWDRVNSKFVIPSGLNNDLDGAFYIGGWDYNIKEGNLVMDALDADENQGKMYNFHFIVRRTTDAYGARKTLWSREGASSIIEAWPIDLTENSYITAITTVGTEAQVVGVEYINLAGVRSSKPWQGVNIIVTRYSDGSSTTTKVVK